MPDLQGKVIDAGVDWLNCSVAREDKATKLLAVGASLLLREEVQGNYKSGWSWQGYEGFKCGGVSLGQRYDGAFLQLRSDQAQENWRKVHRLEPNVSRLDLQATLELAPAQPELLPTAFTDWHLNPPKGHRTAQPTLINNRKTGDTLYVGSWHSDTLGRFYDKGLESKEAGRGVRMRGEIRYARKTARGIYYQLAEIEEERAEISNHVSGYFRRNNLPSWAESSGVVESARVRPKSDALRSLLYIETVVSKMFEKLIMAGYLKQVIEYAGLREYVEISAKGHETLRNKGA